MYYVRRPKYNPADEFLQYFVGKTCEFSHRFNTLGVGGVYVTNTTTIYHTAKSNYKYYYRLIPMQYL